MLVMVIQNLIKYEPKSFEKKKAFFFCISTDFEIVSAKDNKDFF